MWCVGVDVSCYGLCLAGVWARFGDHCSEVGFEVVGMCLEGFGLFGEVLCKVVGRVAVEI